MPKLLPLTLVALIAAGCTTPPTEPVDASRAAVADVVCVESGGIDACPEPAPQPVTVAKAAQSAASTGASLTRSLMRLF